MIFDLVLVSAEECESVKTNCQVSTSNAVNGCRNVTIPYMANAMRDNTSIPRDSSQNTLENIYQKLDEILKGQERFSQEVFRAFEMRSTTDGGKKTNAKEFNHEKCEKKCASLENRISQLEDCVFELKKEIQLLKNE